tara:strand:- start:199 stop:360 length:162 start_codon:yes stop_codon:yes gene_type:complete
MLTQKRNGEASITLYLGMNYKKNGITIGKSKDTKKGARLFFVFLFGFSTDEFN